MKVRFLSILLLLIGLCTWTSRAEARVLLGYVEGEVSAVTQAQVRQFGDRLAAGLNEEVEVKPFADATALRQWLGRFAMLDLALVSRQSAAAHVGEFLVLGAIDSAGDILLVTRQGVTGDLPQRAGAVLSRSGALLGQVPGEVATEPPPAPPSQAVRRSPAAPSERRPDEQRGGLQHVPPLQPGKAWEPSDAVPARDILAAGEPKPGLVLGLVAGRSGQVTTPELSDRMTAYLGRQLGTTLQTRAFSSPENLMDWFGRYRMLDLVLVPSEFVTSRLGEVARPIAVFAGTSGQDTLFIRAELAGNLGARVQDALAAMAETEEGRRLQKDLGVTVRVPEERSPEQVPSQPEEVAPLTPEPIPPQLVAVPRPPELAHPPADLSEPQSPAELSAPALPEPPGAQIRPPDEPPAVALPARTEPAGSAVLLPSLAVKPVEPAPPAIPELPEGPRPEPPAMKIPAAPEIASTPEIALPNLGEVSPPAPPAPSPPGAVLSEIPVVPETAAPLAAPTLAALPEIPVVDDAGDGQPDRGPSTGPDLSEDDAAALPNLSEPASVPRAIAQPDLPQALRPPGVPLPRPGRTRQPPAANDDRLLVASLPEPRQVTKPPQPKQLLPEPVADPGVVYVVPFESIMVPREVESRLFDRFIDALNAGGEKVDRDFVILKEGLDRVGSEWLRSRNYVTGEIFGYVEESSCCSTDLRTKARLVYHKPHQEAPALAFVYPAKIFFDHDRSSLAAERSNIADQVSKALAEELLKTLQP